MKNAFISYSHKDLEYLDLLHTHLATLRREDLINVWYDREILAGDAFNDVILDELLKSELFLALISPYFLSSNYCYEKEMAKAIELQQQGKLRIVAIILEPCDWKHTLLKQFKVVPKDGLPVAEWKNKNSAFLDVVTEIRRILDKKTDKNIDDDVTVAPFKANPPQTQQPKYKIKRQFDSIEKSEFLENCLAIMKEFFQRKIEEIKSVDGVNARFKDISQNGFTCLVLNKMLGNRQGALTVFTKSSGVMNLGDLSYSYTENSASNTANGFFNVTGDDYELWLKRALDFHANQDRLMKADEAATVLWLEMLNRAGINHA